MNIYEAIGSIMKKGVAIGKEKRNQQQNFMYRGIDDVMNVFQPLMSEAGIFMVPEVLEAKREERQSSRGGNLIYSILKVRYTFYAEDGSNVSAVVVGEGMDSGDKASNKAMAVAMKYAMFQTFCIPTEEMPDPDAETPPPSRPQPTQQPTRPTQQAPQPTQPTQQPQPVRNQEALRQQQLSRQQSQQQAPKQPRQAPPPPDVQPGPEEAEDGYYYCKDCGQIITDVRLQNGQHLSPKEVAVMGMQNFGDQICYNCGAARMKARRAG